MKVSIIVPVYNAEKYLQRCIDALLAQTYKDLEIILVNDGSLDNSAEICEHNSEKYSNVFYYYQDNAGPSASRNKGIMHATGKYIGFCDADDYMEPQMIEILVNRILTDKSQLSLCDFFAERINDVVGIPWEDGTLLSREQIVNDMIPEMIGNEEDFSSHFPLWGSVVRCIFLREIIEENNISFKNGINFAEDLMFTLDYLKVIKSVSIVNRALYRYTFNQQSLMNSSEKYQPNMFNDRLVLIEHIRNMLEKINIFEQTKNRLYVTSRSYLLDVVSNICNARSQKSFKEVYKEVYNVCHHDIVKEAFYTYRIKFNKTGIMYAAIKHRLVLLIMVYYIIRSRI